MAILKNQCSCFPSFFAAISISKYLVCVAMPDLAHCLPIVYSPILQTNVFGFVCVFRLFFRLSSQGNVQANHIIELYTPHNIPMIVTAITSS